LNNVRAGFYPVQVTDANSCTSTFRIEVTEPDPLKVFISQKDIQCISDANGSARVDSINGSAAMGILNSYKYLWNTNIYLPNTTLPKDTNRQVYQLMYGIHKVTLTDAKGCKQTESIFINHKDINPPTIICPKDIDITVQTIASIDPNKYLVDLGIPIAFDSCAVDKVTNDAPLKFRAGNTTVNWTVMDLVGLTATCKQQVIVREFPTVPQLISPNGDGINDLFVIEGLASFPNSKLAIFTREGQLVYKSDNYKSDWDGRYSEAKWNPNQIVAQGVYYYVLTLGITGTVIRGAIYVYY
jgi:gliding motility-associated-like protein